MRTTASEFDGSSSLSRKTRWIVASIGIACAVALFFVVELNPEKPAVSLTAGIAVLMATCWITEILPLAVTSLIPIVLLPSLGIQDGGQVAKQYVNDTIFLYIGGFIVAIAMERTGLHRRIALRMLMLIGSSPSRLILGVLLASGCLSMFISNTATTMMMVTIVLALLATCESKDSSSETNRFAKGMLLAAAYGASIGGIATLVGTPTNLALNRILQINFPDRPSISFLQWMIFALPFSAALLGVAWGILTWHWCPRGSSVMSSDHLAEQYRSLGKLTWSQSIVLADFLLLVFLWMTRADLELGSLHLFGWQNLFPHPNFFNDGTVATAAAILLFLIPTSIVPDSPTSPNEDSELNEPNERELKTNNKRTKMTIVDATVINQLPWDIVLLFGGGFALAGAFAESGLSLWVGEQLSDLRHVHPIVLIAIICLVLSFLTELTSNTATAEMILPILAALSVAIGVDPLFLMGPATIVCSLAFMLPVATPPNAIVFASHRLQVSDMVKSGFLLNMVGVVMIVIAVWLWMPVVWSIRL
jgi:solute carrier family 13 (sodium-dependent dicarboxylate transporter), member 2/3/5